MCSLKTPIRLAIVSVLWTSVEHIFIVLNLDKDIYQKSIYITINLTNILYKIPHQLFYI